MIRLARHRVLFWFAGSLAAWSLAIQFAEAQPRQAPAAQAPVADAANPAERTLSDAEQLVDKRQYRAAQRLLEDFLQNQRDPRDPSLRALWGALGDVYLGSGDFNQAVTWLDRSWRAFDEARPPTVRLLADQSAVAVLLSRAYANLSQDEKATAIVRRSYARFAQASLSDTTSQIDLLAQLGALGQASLSDQPNGPSVAREVERLADRLKQDRQSGGVSPKDYGRGLKSLAEYYHATGQYDRVISTAKILLAPGEPMLSETRDRLAMWTLLADAYRHSGDSAAEISSLETAVVVAREPLEAANPPSDESLARARFDRAEVERLLADALARAGRKQQAIAEYSSAAEHYRALLDLASAPKDATKKEEDAVAAVVVLERLVDVALGVLELPGAADSRACHAAIEAHRRLLAVYLQTHLADDPRIGGLRVTLGGLYIDVGDYAHAEQELIEASKYWDERKPENPLMQAKTLNLLGEVALAGQGRLREAQQYLERAEKICHDQLPQDELVLWVQLNLGRLATTTGKYREAFERLQPILSDEEADRVTPKLRSVALLHMGMLCKELTEFDQALAYCLESLSIRQKDLGEGHSALLPHYLALGSLYIALSDPASLEKMVLLTETACTGLAAEHPNRLANRHHEAMVHYLKARTADSVKERAAARECWERLLADLEKATSGDPLLRARVLHYLARVDFLDWTDEVKAQRQKLAQQQNEANRQRNAQIEELERQTSAFQEQLAKYEEGSRQYLKQLDEYDRMANQEFAARKKAYAELIELHSRLETERTSLDTLSQNVERTIDEVIKLNKKSPSDDVAVRGIQADALARGERRAQSAIDLLDTSGKNPSLHYAALCNYAQILQAQSEPTDPNGAPLRRALAALRKAADLAETSRSMSFGAELTRAEFFAQFQTAFDLLVQFNVQAGNLKDAIVAAEQARSRTLADQLRAADIHGPQQRKLDVPALVDRWRNSTTPLLYYYVGETSYLFMLGGSSPRLSAVRLKVQLAADAPQTITDVNTERAADLTTRLRQSLKDPQTAQNIRGSSRLRGDLASLSAVLMPREVVDFLRLERAQGVSHATVIPHGAINQLPLEALVLASPSTELFLADVAPPLAYAPSLSILEILSARPQRATSPRLVTLGNPDYANRASRGPDDGLALEPLLASQQECQRIEAAFARRFGPRGVTMLTGDMATEGKLRDALLTHPTLVHLAAHALVGDDQGGLFARIALASPPGSANGPDDGDLDLAEIYGLDLTGCELSILSACDTNLSANSSTSRGRIGGAVREALARGVARGDSSFSLASAFLAAGATRVLATQWEVADDSTSEIVASFVEQLAIRLADSHEINYARLLAEARSQLRLQKPEWDSPYHWAPLVLIGPAE